MIRAIVLAAGKGTRMKSARSKVLHEICGRPMLWYVLRALRGAGIDEIVVVVNDELAGADRRASASRASCKPSSSEPATRCASRSSGSSARRGGRIVVACGDMPLVTAELFGAVAGSLDGDALGDGARHRQDAAALELRPHRSPRRDASSESSRRATRRPRARDRRDERGHLRFRRGRAARRDRRGCAPTTRRASTISPIPSRTSSVRARRVRAVPASDHLDVLGINDRVELARARREMNARLCAQHMRDGVTIVDPRPTYLEPELEIGADSRDLSEHDDRAALPGGPRLRDRARTAASPTRALGDRVTVRESVVIDAADRRRRLDRAVRAPARRGAARRRRARRQLRRDQEIGAGARRRRSSHLSYLGDATVGEGTNVGAGTITCNFDGEQKNATVVGRDVSIGSNTSLVAPVSVGDGALTGAGSVVTKDVPAGERVAGNPARPLPKKIADAPFVWRPCSSAAISGAAVARHAAAAAERPNALDRRVDALTQAQLMTQPAHALVDPARQAAALRRAHWTLLGWLLDLAVRSGRALLSWSSGGAAALRDWLRRRVRSEWGVRFLFGAALALVARVAALLPAFYLYRVDRILQLTTDLTRGGRSSGSIHTLLGMVVAGLIAAVVLWLAERTHQWYVYTIVGRSRGERGMVVCEPLHESPRARSCRWMPPPIRRCARCRMAGSERCRVRQRRRLAMRSRRVARSSRRVVLSRLRRSTESEVAYRARVQLGRVSRRTRSRSR